MTQPMTEAEWLASTDPVAMLDSLNVGASDRKLRLFAVACCRRVWSLLKPKRLRRAVKVAERYADGKASGSELRLAHWALRDRTDPATNAARWTATEDAGEAASQTMEWVGVIVGLNWDDDDESRQAILFRELFGNPFRPATLAPSWLAWHGGLIASMAQRMYESRDFSDMPVLADALEEAGCRDEDILSHGRSEDEHFRGCWVIDLLLGKS